MAQSMILILVFVSPNCIYCHKMEPIIKELQREGYNIHVVDVSKNSELVKKYHVDSYPTSVVVDTSGGSRRRVGFMEKEEFVDFITGASEKCYQKSDSSPFPSP